MPLLYTIKGKKALYILADAALVAAAWFTAALIIYGPSPVPDLVPLLISAASYLLSFYFFQVYRVIWAYYNARDVYRLISANGAAAAVSVFGFIATGEGFSRAVALPGFLLICGATVIYRVLIKDRMPAAKTIPNGNGAPWWTRRRAPEKRILVVGAGDAGRMILAEYAKKGLDPHILGFIDDDPAKIGRIINGKMILAPSADIGGVIRDRRVSEVIIAMPSVGAGAIDKIITDIKRADPAIPVRTLPPFTRVFERSLSPDLRELDIGDLLGREEFGIDTRAIEAHFAGKTVLVTGAGGSIGSEICKQLLQFNISRLVAVGRGEYSIYSLAKTLGEYMYYLESETDIVYRIADVKDRAMMELIFEAYRPDIVFHAAAHKHVPLMEFNEIEAVQNNVIGSLNVFEVSLAHGVSECVLVSTDKAVHPVNVMGATKRAAELLAQYYFRERGLNISIVRFGNVIGSRGSVIPLFREQIERGGPVTVTHPDITRYFMSIPEASILLINAAAYASGGEVFVLDMGKQYRVADIARNLIRLYGYEPERDIRIQYTGLRPGEKLYEELFYGRESLIGTRNEKIFILGAGAEGYNRDVLERFLGERLGGLFRCTTLQVREMIREIVPEFEFEVPPGNAPRLVN